MILRLIIGLTLLFCSSCHTREMTVVMSDYMNNLRQIPKESCSIVINGIGCKKCVEWLYEALNESCKTHKVYLIYVASDSTSLDDKIRIISSYQRVIDLPKQNYLFYKGDLDGLIQSCEHCDAEASPGLLIRNRHSERYLEYSELFTNDQLSASIRDLIQSRE